MARNNCLPSIIKDWRAKAENCGQDIDDRTHPSGTGERKMGKAKDYTGQKFGRLTFVRMTEQRNKSKSVLWELICECGEVCHLVANNVVRGHVKSCGCYKKEQYSILHEKNRQYSPEISSARVIWRQMYKEIDFDTFYHLSQMPCYYCGCQPHKVFNSANGAARRKKASIMQLQFGDFTYNGLDRIDSGRDHSMDNVVPSCTECNTAKMDNTLDEFLEHIEMLYSHTRRLR